MYAWLLVLACTGVLTPKTLLDVAELVTIKSVSLSNSHISRTEKLSTKAVWKVSVDRGNLLSLF